MSVYPQPSPGQPFTVIYSPKGKDYSARKLAEWLGLPPGQVVNNPTLAPPSEADIVIVAAGDVRLWARGP